MKIKQRKISRQNRSEMSRLYTRDTHVCVCVCMCVCVCLCLCLRDLVEAQDQLAIAYMRGRRGSKLRTRKEIAKSAMY
jgi:hypothetical protein